MANFEAAGNRFFREGKFSDAVEQYSLQINALEAEVASKNTPQLKQKFTIALSNRCASHLKIASNYRADNQLEQEEGQLELAWKDAEEALKHRPEWFKAHVRLGEVFEAASPYTWSTAVYCYALANKHAGEDQATQQRMQERVMTLQQQSLQLSGQDSEEVLKRALRWSAMVAPSNPTYLSQRLEILRLLGDLYAADSKLDEALTYYQEAITTITQNSIPENKLESITLTLGKLYVKIADVLEKQGNIEEAIVKLEKSHDILKRMFGSYSLQLLPSTTMLLRLLEQSESASGQADPQHEDKSNPSESGAASHRSQLKARLQHRIRILNSLKEIAGHHPSLNTLSLQVREHIDANKLDLALETAKLGYQQSVEAKNSNPDDELFVSIFARLIAEIYQMQQDFSQSKQYYEELLAFQTKFYGPQDAETADAMLQVAMLLEKMQQWPQAIEKFQEAIHIFEHDPEFVAKRPLIFAYHHLSTSLLENKQSEEAEKTIEKAISLAEQAFGPHHVELSNLLRTHSIITDQSQNWAKTRQILLRCHTLDEQYFSAHHSVTRSTLEHIARCDVMLGDWASAVTRLEKLVASHAQSKSPDMSKLKSLRETLVQARRALAVSQDNQTSVDIRQNVVHLQKTGKAKEKGRVEEEGEVKSGLLLCANRACGKREETAGEFKLCSRCRHVVFCSRECQVAAWKVHKLACQPN